MSDISKTIFDEVRDVLKTRQAIRLGGESGPFYTTTYLIDVTTELEKKFILTQAGIDQLSKAEKVLFDILLGACNIDISKKKGEYDSKS